ncbi:hypothetical protein [Carboxylicivirga taeanensis]
MDELSGLMDEINKELHELSAFVKNAQATTTKKTTALLLPI